MENVEERGAAERAAAATTTETAGGDGARTSDGAKSDPKDDRRAGAFDAADEERAGESDWTGAARGGDDAEDAAGARAGKRRAWAVWGGRRAAYLAAGALAIGLLYGWLQFSTDAICCGDFDGYYHARWSQLLWRGARAGDFPPDFRWLPHTTLNQRDYVDHHLLFHLLQAPFVSFGETRAGQFVAARTGVAPDALGTKLSTWLFACLAVFSCYWLVVRHRLRYPVLWLVALLGCSAPFLFRMNMAKAMSFSIILLVVGINLLFRRKYIWLLPLAFVFTLAYDMFVLLGAAALVWTCVVAWSERRFEWRPLAYVAAGVVLGTVVNPYFPSNVRLLYQHAVMKIGVTDADRPRVGNEWYPYESWDFLRNCTVAFAAMIAGYVAFNARDRRRAQVPLFFLVFSTALLVANAKWRRFAEYWPPFAILFAAFSVHASLLASRSELLGRVVGARTDSRGEEVPAHLRDEARRRETWGFMCACVAAAALCVPLAFNAIAETEEIADSAPHSDYRAGAEWLRQNVPAGETVFNTDWDDFPRLFYYDPAHVYVSGLDPTYLYDRDPALSKLYEEITLGRERDPGPLIRERFGARYVFTDNEDVHDQFYDTALDSGWFDEVYSDESCTILRVREQKGAPPPPAEPPPDDAPDDAPGSEGDPNGDGDGG